MMFLRSSRVAALACILLLVPYGNVGASDDCPSYSQQQGTVNGTPVLDVGLAVGATVNTDLYSNSNGDFESTTQAAIDSAASGVAKSENAEAISGVITSGSFDMSNPQGVLSQLLDVPTNYSASNVLNAVMMASQDQINSMSMLCSGAAACTINMIDSSGFTVAELTYVLASATVNPLFEELMTHEFGHGDLGLQDCSVNCTSSNTIMNPLVSGESPSAPTPCDESYTDSEICPCNS
jgi:hypothetical protein